MARLSMLAVALAAALTVASAASDDESPTGRTGARWATTPFLEPDRCAVAWAIRVHVDPGARFEFHAADSMPAGVVTYDLPDSKIRRDARRAAFEVLLELHQLDDPVLRVIGRLVHDAEISAWSSRRPADSLTFERVMIDGLTRDDDPRAALRRCFALLDDLVALNGAVEIWRARWERPNGSIRDRPAD